jgi:ubiquinone/menaquinone biosynthesis C-methylase UbiE
VPKVVLNVGCGNKLILSRNDRFVINIDAVPPADLNTVTVVDSLESLETVDVSKPLFLSDDAAKLVWVKNDSADEVHAYHLIEHFAAYDAPLVLLRWFEVLKPGGILALEQPDIVKCAINLLQLETTQIGHVTYNLGILGFYGAQERDAPLMSHKYGWTYRTLQPVLQGVGFYEVEEQPAQTHAKTSRDFRVEARKPING